MASLKDLGNSLQGFFSNAGKAVSSALPQVGQAVWNATPIGQVQQLQKLAPQVQSFIQKYPSPASYIGPNIIQPAINQMKINNERSLTPVQKAMPNIFNNTALQSEAKNIGEGLKSVWDLGPGMAPKMLQVPFAADPQAAYRQTVQDIPGNILKGVGLAFKAGAPLVQYGYQLGMAPIKGALQSHRTGESFGQATENAVINQPGLGTAAFGEGPKAMLGNVGEFVGPMLPNLAKSGIGAIKNIKNLKQAEKMAAADVTLVEQAINNHDAIIRGGKLTDYLSPEMQKTEQTLRQMAEGYLGKKAAKMPIEEIKNALRDRTLYDTGFYQRTGMMGIVGKNNTFQEPYARGDISNLSKKLDEILGTKEFMMTGKYTDVLPARQKAMQQLEHYASQGDEGALKAYEIAQDLENELAKATNAKNGWKQPLTKLPQPESLQPMAKLPQVGEMAPLAPDIQNTQFPKTGTVPTQAAQKAKTTGFEAEMDALAAQTKPNITTIGKKKPLPKMAGSDAEKLAEKAQLNAEGNKKGFQKIFSDFIGERNAAQTKGVQVGSKIRILPANPEEVIKAIENPGMKVSPETEKYIAQFRALDDEVFAQAKKLGLDINYLKEHIAHFWKQDPQEVQQAYAVFKQKYGLTERRVIPTYEEGIKIGLTPKFTSPAQILAESVKKLEETKAGIKAFESLKEQGFIVPASVGSKNPGFVPISAPGFPRNATQINDQLGTVGNWYAPKAVADQINRVFSPQDFGPLGSMLDKAAGLSGKIQDLGLSGGLPGTPMNAFGAAQVTKETLAGRGIQGVTSFIRSFSDTATRNYFEKNSQQLIKMQERNIPISTNFSINDLAGDGIGSNVSSAINNLIKGQFGPAKDAIGSIWQKAMNEPTFKRFMPQLQVELFNDIERSALKQGKSANEAADIAAQAVKNFYGSTGSDVAARAQGIHDPLVQKTLSTLTFAPKFRESMINFWVNNIKALKNPTALENRANITFVGGAIATYIAMDKINYALNGKHLNENPPGTEDKLLIPTGNGDVIGVPFLSSIATIPRALYREGKMVVSGDIKGAAKDAFQSYASMMIKPIADVVSNADYFGKKIYNEEDKPQEKFAAQAKYLVSQLAIHPYLKELFTPSKQDDPIYQRLSRSMELPLKFYTNASLNSKYYYSERDKAVGGLSDQEKSALAAIPKADSEDPNTRILKYQTYLTYPKVFDAKQKIELEMAAKTGKAIDPLYLVNYDVAKKYMRYETLPEGSQDRKEMTKAYPELLGLFQARSKYFTENPYPGSGSGSSRPVPSPAVQQAMNNQNWTAPGVREYLNANTAYNNAQREKLGLPPLAGYTQYAKKPKKVKIIKAKAMKTPKMGKTKVANFKIAKPKKVKVTKSKPITYRSIMSKA